jgi:beta-glucosidase
LINYINDKYAKPSNIPIWITENGFPVEDESKLPLARQREDDLRQKYFGEYLKELVEAVRDDKVNIGGYMAWSLLEYVSCYTWWEEKLMKSNLEWIMGYKPRFGLTVVDRKDGCKRYPKQSAYLLRDIFAHVKAQ